MHLLRESPYLWLSLEDVASLDGIPALPGVSGEPESKDYQCIINHFSSLYPDYSKLDLVIAVSAFLSLLTPAPRVLTMLQGYSAGSLYASVSLPPTPPPHRTRYILISYPYSVLWALTALHSSRYTSRLEELVSQPTSEALIVYGTQDQFTAVGKYRSWREGLEGIGRTGEGGGGKAPFVEVEGADHFWGSKRNELKAVIQGWL